MKLASQLHQIKIIPEFISGSSTPIVLKRPHQASKTLKQVQGLTNFKPHPNVGQALPDNKENLVGNNSCVVGPEQLHLRTSALFNCQVEPDLHLSPSSVLTGHLPPHGEATHFNAPSTWRERAECVSTGVRGCRCGFTLIELLVVVLIIGILAAIALPQYQKAVEKSKAVQAISVLKTLAQAQYAYYLNHGQYATNFEKLDATIPWDGNTSWSTFRVTDTRSNQDWSLQLYNQPNGNEHEIYMGRLTGPYKGAGFILPLTVSNNKWKEGKIYCAEHSASEGVEFKLNQGQYCQDLFNGTLVYPATYVKIFSMP